MIIIVNSEKEKLEVIEALKHIHDADIDTDIPMVNKLAHLQPDDIQMIECFAVFNQKDEILNPVLINWKNCPYLCGNLQSAYEWQKQYGGIIAKIKFSNISEILNCISCAFNGNSNSINAEILEFIPIQKIT